MIHSNKNYNCNKCEHSERINRNCYLLRGRTLNDSDGPFEKADAVFWYEYNGDTHIYYECPVPHITNDTRRLIYEYRHYKNGFLKQLGGISDQPTEWLDAMTLIEIEMDKISEERQEEMSRRQAARGLNG